MLQVLALAVQYQEDDRENRLPSAEWVEERARAAGASEGACLVMVRREIRDADGEAIPLDRDRVYHRKPGIVRDAVTCVALEIKALPGIRVLLERPDGTRISHRDLLATAELWSE